MANRESDDLKRIPKLDTAGITINAGGFKIDDLADSGRKRELDPTDYLEKLANKTREEVNKASKAIEKGAEGIALKEIDKTGELLFQARQLVEKKDYLGALEVLARLLKEDPNHPEGLYLKALCYYHLNRDEKALETLQPLNAASLERRIADNVNQLRSSISLKMITLFLDLMKEKQYSRAEKLLQRYIELDPGRTLYYAMLATLLMGQERLREARDIIIAGMESCNPGEIPLLDILRKEIEKRYLAQAMQPALRLYKKKQYSEAKAALIRLEPDLKCLPVYVIFFRYLSALGGGGIFSRFRSPRDTTEVVPAGEHEDVESFHFFLVRAELDAGQKYISEEKIRLAEDTLGEAVGYAPHFPFINFLYGACIFHRVNSQAGSSERPDLDTMLADIEKAAYHARKGLGDREIAGAPKLVELIENTLKMLREVKEEANLINAVIDEFKQIMDSAEGGVTSIAQLDNIVARFKSLKARTREITGKVKSKQGKDALAQLSQAINRNLDKAESEKKETMPLNAAIEEFKRIVDSAKSGMTATKLNELRNSFSALKRKIPDLRIKVTSKSGKEALDALEEGINNYLKKIDSAGENNQVNEAVLEFNRIMTSITGVRPGRTDVFAAVKDLVLLKTKIPDIRRSVHNHQAEVLLDTLESKIDDILRNAGLNR